MQAVIQEAPQAVQQISTPTQSSATRTEITMRPYPLKVQVDSPVDWVPILATIVIALLGAYITWVTSQATKQGLAAPLRHAWHGDFQKACADFVSSATHLHYKKIGDRRYLLSAQADDQLVKLETAKASIIMLLPINEVYAIELKNIMNEVQTALYERDPTLTGSARDHLKKFVDKAQTVRGFVWTQIGKDLALPK